MEGEAPFHGVNMSHVPGVHPTMRLAEVAVGATVYTHGALVVRQATEVAAVCGGSAGCGPAVAVDVVEKPMRTV